MLLVPIPTPFNAGLGLRLFASQAESGIITTPADIQSGDLWIIPAMTHRSGGTASATLTGFTLLTSQIGNISTDNFRLGVWSRACDGAEDSSYSYAHTFSSGYSMIFRDDAPIIDVQASVASDINVQMSGGNPSAQTINGNGEAGPLIAFAFAFNNAGALGFTTESPAFDQTWSANGNSEAGLTIFQSSDTPVDFSVDTGDNAYINGLISGFIQPQY